MLFIHHSKVQACATPDCTGKVFLYPSERRMMRDNPGLVALCRDCSDRLEAHDPVIVRKLLGLRARRAQ